MGFDIPYIVCRPNSSKSHLVWARLAKARASIVGILYTSLEKGGIWLSSRVIWREQRGSELG